MEEYVTTYFPIELSHLTMCVRIMFYRVFTIILLQLCTHALM